MKPRDTLRRSKPQSEASEEIFRVLFHHHPFPMWVYDLETLAFLEVNQAAVEKYGYARDEFLKMTLKAYGYKALTARDGAEGVALFAENKKNIKVVITDIMMPVMNGTAAILALQRINPDVKIIAASGLTKGQITTPSDSNVQAFLTKPYTAAKLLKALAAVLR